MRSAQKIFISQVDKDLYSELTLQTQQEVRDALRLSAKSGTIIDAQLYALPRKHVKKLAWEDCDRLTEAFAQVERRGKHSLQQALLDWQCEENGRYRADRRTASKIIEAAFSDKVLNSWHPKKIEFKNLNLGTMPACLSKLRYVERLIFENCSLTEIKTFPPRMVELDITRAPNLLMPPLPDGLTHLNLENCDLSVLPALPVNLMYLNVSNNYLTCLGTRDQPFPANLRELNAANNNITELGLLPSKLYSLNVEDNFLTSIPPLPENIVALEISNNFISRLPAPPPTLYKLIAAHNCLTDLPDELANIAPDFAVNLSHNPIPDSVTNKIIQRILAQDSENERTWSPTIFIDKTPTTSDYFFVSSMKSDFSKDLAVPSGNHMPEAVLWWYHKKQETYDVTATRSRNWHVANKRTKDDFYDNTPVSFGKFMVRLTETAEYKNPFLKQSYKERIVELLDVLEFDNSLRRKCFLIAQDALGECQDRVAFGLETMLIEALNTKAASGKLDEKKLLDHCIGQYKLEELKNISAKKVANEPHLDEIEVYLYFQVKLAKLLDLPISTAEISYPADANIRDSDVASAISHINKALLDDEALADFMIQHAPWKTHLETNATLALRGAWEKRETQAETIQQNMATMIEELDEIRETKGELSIDAFEKNNEINNLRTTFNNLEATIERPILKEMTLVCLNKLSKSKA